MLDALSIDSTRIFLLPPPKGLIKWVINGYNATVFAYGATGCGKTYTMLGNEDSPGIMARTLNDLFLEMNNNADNRYQVING